MKYKRLIAFLGLTFLQCGPAYAFSIDEIIDRAKDGEYGIDGQNGENGQNGAYR